MARKTTAKAKQAGKHADSHLHEGVVGARLPTDPGPRGGGIEDFLESVLGLVRALSGQESGEEKLEERLRLAYCSTVRRPDAGEFFAACREKIVAQFAMFLEQALAGGQQGSGWHPFRPHKESDVLFLELSILPRQVAARSVEGIKPLARFEKVADSGPAGAAPNVQGGPLPGAEKRPSKANQGSSPGGAEADVWRAEAITPAFGRLPTELPELLNVLAGIEHAARGQIATALEPVLNNYLLTQNPDTFEAKQELANFVSANLDRLGLAVLRNGEACRLMVSVGASNRLGRFFLTPVGSNKASLTRASLSDLLPLSLGDASLSSPSPDTSIIAKTYTKKPKSPER